MEQASYYLDQSREGASYSLALIGDRASGKTSLLNSLASYGDETGLVAAQIRLDEGYSKDELDFFREVFHSLMEKAAEKGVFGGQSGAEYDTFCRQILTHDLTTSRENEPLAFGRVYATARTQERTITLSRRMLLSDLEVIVDHCRDAGFPAVVLLLDEADVLATNHALLQTIRNLLMDSSHFSMIAAGTEQMFPAISEVFSPVPRQFVRINVGPFRRWGDTRKAIQRRLVLSGEEWAMPGNSVCKELHSLTRGNPYELMLVSHFAYRELTRKKQRVPMQITPTVIEAVADQLEEQNPAVQQTLAQLRELDSQESETIRELIDLNGIAVHSFALAELDFSKPFDRVELERAEGRVEKELSRLSKTGFLSVADGTVHIDADSFQRALIRYVVLGRREDSERVEASLREPSQRIADKILGSLSEVLRTELPGTATKDMVFEIHGVEPAVSVRLAFEPEYNPEDYDTQATVRLDSDGTWVGLFVFRSTPNPEVMREEIAEVLAKATGHYEAFGVDITGIEVAPLDLEAIREFQNQVQSADDPIEELVMDAKGAFSQNRPDMLEKVRSAANALLALEPDDFADRLVDISDCAFMALLADEPNQFRVLSDRLLAEGQPPILHEVTRALWEAANGEEAQALTRLEFPPERLEGLADRFRLNLLMYSPAVLASQSPKISYADLVGDVSLSDVISSYQIAIQARIDKKSVASALGERGEAVRWELGAAADAAELESKPDYAKRLRRLAADRVDSADVVEDKNESATE